MKQVRKGKYTKRVSNAKRLKRSAKRRLQWFRGLSTRNRIAVIALPVLAILIIIPLATYAYYARDISDQERLMNRNNTGVVFTDRSGDDFYSIGRAKQRDLVPLSDISDSVEEALIAGEDKNFYEHSGFSVISIAQALFTNVSSGDLNAYGGSTLTQQLAKNTLLSNNKSFLRKYQELAVAVAIERNYTKDEILSMYLNSVYYGENAFGIADAAEVYFDKKPSELNLAESAMLIGVLPAPSAYSPISGSKEYAKERQETVLSRMVKNEYITEAEKDKALKQKLSYAPADNQVSDAPHFVEMVLKQLEDTYGSEVALRSGYRVKTTLELKTQRSLKKNLDANMPYINGNNGSNASGIAIDPKTGEVLALVGSADYNNEKWGKVNMTTTARQPGSSFKPIYFAAALAEGAITPATVLEDKAININGWQPQNADGRFRGNVTSRDAIGQSLNIPSIEVMEKYGVGKSVAAANRMNIDGISQDKQYGLSLALGSAETDLMEMTNAYAAFANQGVQHTPSIILSINDKFDKQIYTASRQDEQVISKQGAFLISDILADQKAKASVFGSTLSVPGKTVAVKTGTTDENRDAWTIGYTPSLAVGVWVGNNDNEPMYNGGSLMAGPIWRGTMIDILAERADEPFVIPDGITQRATCYSNYGIATNDIREGTFMEYYLISALPSKTCEPKKTIEIKVCNLGKKKIETINEEDFDDKKYSKDLDNCEEEEPEGPIMVQVCELATGEIVTIEETVYDEALYSEDTEACAPPDGNSDETEPQANRKPQGGAVRSFGSLLYWAV